MISKKKAQGMSINVIIIAALAIAVLVVLFAVFTGRISLVGKQLDSCTNLGGTCSTGDSCDSTGNINGLKEDIEYTKYSTTKEFSDCKDKGKGDVCCIPIKK